MRASRKAYIVRLPKKAPHVNFLILLINRF